MKPFRAHSVDVAAYDDQLHRWETPVDGEAGTERAAVRAASATDEPRIIVAGLYGCTSWDQFEALLAVLPKDDGYVAAHAAIEAGDRDALKRIVTSDPSLVTERGPDGATLLDHAIWKTDHGDWSWPPGPGNAAADRLLLVELLLDAGADVEQGNLDGWAPLHSAAYTGWLPSVERLLARGARVDRSTKGDGGTPLALALFWGHRQTAERLAEEGIVPRNLRIAAALGREDLMDGAGGDHREFYRPHQGFKSWQPSEDPAEIRDEALIWACRNGRVEVLDRIGGDVDAEVAGTTPLLAAAGNGHVECVRLLLDRGADVQRTAGQWREATALHAAAWFNHLDTVKLLVERGARCDVREPVHDGLPHDWAVVHGNEEVAEWLARHGTPKAEAEPG